MKKLKDKKGYISIESVVVIGLVLLSGLFITISLYDEGKELTAKSMGTIFEKVEIPMEFKELGPEEPIPDDF